MAIGTEILGTESVGSPGRSGNVSDGRLGSDGSGGSCGRPGIAMGTEILGTESVGSPGRSGGDGRLGSDGSGGSCGRPGIAMGTGVLGRAGKLQLLMVNLP